MNNKKKNNYNEIGNIQEHYHGIFRNIPRQFKIQYKLFKSVF